MNKHFKELVFIIISISPLLAMSIVSNLIETPTEISYEGLDRKILMLSNSFLLFFFLIPYFVIRNNPSYLMNYKKVKLLPIIMVIFTTVFFIILNAPVIEWNKSISFPSFMSSFESWALLKEKQLESLTLYLVSFENNFEYLIGIIAIAIIPGFCEEYFFRGVLAILYLTNLSYNFNPDSLTILTTVSKTYMALSPFTILSFIFKIKEPVGFKNLFASLNKGNIQSG